MGMCRCVYYVSSQWLDKPQTPGRLRLRIDDRCAKQRRFLRLRSGRSERGKVENLKLIVDGLKSSLALVVGVFVVSCRSHPFRVPQSFRIFVAEAAAAGAFSSRL